jgi:hypothetical protein
MCSGCWENCFQTAEKITGFGLWGAEIGCMVSIGHTETNVRARHKTITSKKIVSTASESRNFHSLNWDFSIQWLTYDIISIHIFTLLYYFEKSSTFWISISWFVNPPVSFNSVICHSEKQNTHRHVQERRNKDNCTRRRVFQRLVCLQKVSLEHNNLTILNIISQSFRSFIRFSD